MDDPAMHSGQQSALCWQKVHLVEPQTSATPDMVVLPAASASACDYHALYAAVCMSLLVKAQASVSSATSLQ